MRGTLIWTLAVAAVLPGQDLTPLRLGDVVKLIGADVDASALRESARKHGLAFPGTPAVRRWLRARGATDPTLEALFPTPAASKRRQALEPSRLSLEFPVGWTATRRERTWRLAPDDGAPASTSYELSIHLAPWTADPAITTMQDLLDGRLAAYTKERGYTVGSRSPLPARGITGVVATLKRGRIGERPAHVRLALFQHGAWLVTIRGAVAGAANDPFVQRVMDVTGAVFASVAPHATPLPSGIATRVMVLEQTSRGRELVVCDRAGRAQVSPAAEAPHRLVNDPLGLTVAWFDEGRRPANQLGDGDAQVIGRGLMVRDLDPSALRTLDPDQRNARMDVAERQLLFVHAGDTPDTLRVGVGPLLKDDERPPTVLATFRPALHIELVDDPGSSWVLCAVASRHFPVPGSGGRPVSAGRLVYVSRDPEQPPRDLLVRTADGPEAPVIFQPRFLPSGFEVLFIDPARGLCVMPRDGGLPVILRPGASILAAEPWIDAR